MKQREHKAWWEDYHGLILKSKHTCSIQYKVLCDNIVHSCELLIVLTNVSIFVTLGILGGDCMIPVCQNEISTRPDGETKFHLCKAQNLVFA